MIASESITVGKSDDKLRQVVWVDQFWWRCDICGWLGTGLVSPEAAAREGKRHFDAEHAGGRG